MRWREAMELEHAAHDERMDRYRALNHFVDAAFPLRPERAVELLAWATEVRKRKLEGCWLWVQSLTNTLDINWQRAAWILDAAMRLESAEAVRTRIEALSQLAYADRGETRKRVEPVAYLLSDATLYPDEPAFRAKVEPRFRKDEEPPKDGGSPGADEPAGEQAAGAAGQPADAVAAVTEVESEVVDAKPKANRPRRRYRPRSGPVPLTAAQLEAVQMVAECEGNISKAARLLGKDPSTVRQANKEGLAKLGMNAPKHRTIQASRDRRGCEDVTYSDDRRLSRDDE